MLRFLLVICFVQSLTGLAPSLHAQLIELPFEEIIGRSPLVVEGRVLAQESFWDNAHRNIFTSNTIQVTRVFKGSLAAPGTLKVLTWGGIVGNDMQLVSESAQFSLDDAGLFCLLPSKLDLPVGSAWENYGSPHGFFQYNLSENRIEHPFHPSAGITAFRERIRQQTREQEEILPGKQLEPNIGNRATPVISSFTPSSITAGTQSNLTINGSNFGADPGTNGTVRFFNSNTGTLFSVDASDIVSWADDEIVVEVPSRTVGSSTAGTGTFQVRNDDQETGTSASTLTVEYAHSNVLSSGVKYAPRLVNGNGNGGMTFTFSTSICSGSTQNAANAFGRALRAWRCVSGVNWVMSSSTTTSNSTGSDLVNIVTFDIGTPLPGGVLGRTTSYYSGCFSSGSFHWRVNEIDVNMNNSYTWYYCDDPTPSSMPSNSFDFQSVAFHELGHGHQLSHIISSGAVMHRSISNNTIKRTLNANETAGAAYALGLSANPCGAGPMTLVSAQDCMNMIMPSACNGAGTCTVSLPVELMEFYGTAEQSGVLVKWSTASEHNNAHFTLERATDAVHFSALTQVPGAAASNEPRHYQYLDTRPQPGLNYYRLRQTDLDGSTALLGIIVVKFGSENEPVRVFPNPVNAETIFVSAENMDAGTQLDIILTDLSGRLIRQQLVDVSATASAFELDGLTPGAYLLFVYQPANRQLLQQTLVIKQ
jgi:hypothetical protein